MGVYQSATEPKVSRKTYVEVVPGNVIDSVGKRKLVKWMRKNHHIPAKVVPEESLTSLGWEFRFDWFQVETFN